MRSRAAMAGLALGLALPTALGVRSATQEAPLSEERVAASNPHRTAQARELDAYIRRLKADSSRFRDLFRPDYGSVREYERSVRPLRDAFANSIGYPPPGNPDRDPPRIERIGEDAIGVYHRTWIPVLPGVNAYGILIVPKGQSGRRPLVVSMHGGGGSPEVALFHGGANYRGMVRGGVKRGYVVWAPQHLFRAEGFPEDVRRTTDDRLRLLGTSLTAVEVAKIARGLDVLLRRPEVDPKRVAMVGLSYGGYYTLVATALEPRIRVAVSSCYFGIQEHRYALDELSVPPDFRFPGRMSLFRDAALTALICPRPLEIQAGERDTLIPVAASKAAAPESAEPYRRLKRESSFRYVVFDGGHEFHDETAWDWLQRHL